MGVGTGGGAGAVADGAGGAGARCRWVAAAPPRPWREGMAWAARERVALERQSGWYTLRQRNTRVLTRLRRQRNRT